MDEIRAKRIYATLNAIVFVLNQLDRRYAELVKMFHEYRKSKAQDESVGGPQRVTLDIGYLHGNYMVSLAWDIVDWCDRLRKIARVTAGIKRKDEWFQKLESTLEITKDVRNFLQHYDGEINTFVSESYPLMGSISAHFPTRDEWHAYVIMSTPIASVYHKSSKISPNFETPPAVDKDIDLLTFSIAERSLNLTDLATKLKAAKLDMSNYMEKEYEFVWPEF